jgi:D-alanyl-lipoteichoic acid acyltransferase DltB (MBOAT superfamily)
LGLIVPSILGNYGMGRWISSCARMGLPHAAPTYFAVAANLLLLGYFKYANFVVDNLNLLSGWNWTIDRIVLPLGISFFTFTQIAYILDARQGKLCDNTLGDFFLFVTFFPHLIAGPVIHHSEMMPQFEDPKTYRFNWDNFATGLWIFAAGLAKKVLIADGLSNSASRVFTAAGNGTPLYALDAWAGVLAYTFQIYFDFSGYSDMAVGLAKMFGIVLPLNFNSPYKATSMIDFWRRWHITLSRFLKDYVYIPLGGNRCGTLRNYGNLLATMVIGGIWHGAGWTFLAWGALHGAVLALNHWWRSLQTKKPAPKKAPAALQIWRSRILTFAVVILGWVFFRAETFGAATHLLGSMFGVAPSPALGTETLLKSKMWIWFGLLLLWVWFLPNVAEITFKQLPYKEVSDERHSLENRRLGLELTPGWAVFAGLLIALAVLSLSRASEFLYYNF